MKILASTKIPATALRAVAGGLLAALALGACAPVQPWERGNLAKPIMAPDPSSLQSSLRVHIYASREAAGAATFGAAGGGCGCN